MPVAFPDASTVDLSRPDIGEIAVLSSGVISAVAPRAGLTETQRLLLAAIFQSMTDHAAVLDAPAITPEDFAAALSRRNEAFRSRIVQIMVLLAMTLRPLDADVASHVGAFARELNVDDGMLDVAQRFAAGNLGLAAFDFERNGYTSEWNPSDAAALHTSGELASAWDLVVDDPELADRWASLEQLPTGSLGREVSEFYSARGFTYPGQAGSAPPLLAQHDWVHVLAEYGTTVESELEVFAFIARANDDLKAFSLLAMVVSLFETGYLRTGAGLFESSTGHLSQTGMAARVADAMRRGALCSGSVDFMRTDWFSLASLSVGEAREHFGVDAKAQQAITAGSVGPWSSGGISPFQYRAGQTLAERRGLTYDSFGAQPLP